MSGASPRPLSRTLGVAGVLFLTLSVSTPASSVFVIVPGIVQAAGAGALWAFLLAGLVGVATAFIYAELSSAFPNAGGEYVMVARTLGPLPGFVVLAINVFNNVLFPPVIGLGVGAMLAPLLPGIRPVPVAMAVVTGATLCALFNIRLNAFVTGIFLAVEVVALALLTWLGLAHPVNALAPMLWHPLAAGEGLPPATPATIGIATTVALFALSGYGMAVYFGEDMHDASARIGRVILLSFGLSFALQTLPLVALLVGTPDLPAMLKAADPFGELVQLRGGAVARATMSSAVVIAIVNAAIATVLASSRFLYATARDRVWGAPVDRALGLVAPRSGTPWVATLAVGATGVLCCLVSLPFLLILNGAGLIVTYAAISLAAIAGRQGGVTAHAVYRMRWFPVAPVVTLAALGYVGWVSWFDPVEGRPGILATAAQMAAAVAYYLLVVRRRGAWTPHDPAA